MSRLLETEFIIDAATNNKMVSRENKLYNVFSYFDLNLRGKNYTYLDKFLNIFDYVFTFDKTIFGINDNDIKKYRDQYDILENKIKDFGLLEILKKHGKYFEVKINNDPSLSMYKERWNKYLSRNC